MSHARACLFIHDDRLGSRQVTRCARASRPPSKHNSWGFFEPASKTIGQLQHNIGATLAKSIVLFNKSYVLLVTITIFEGIG